MEISSTLMDWQAKYSENVYVTKIYVISIKYSQTFSIQTEKYPKIYAKT